MPVEITAPLSGDILEIAVKLGDAVSAEDELLVLEAMKMENPIYAPEDGKVAEVRIAVGDTVEANDVLIVLE